VASIKAAPYRAEALRRGWSTPGGWPRFPGYVVERGRLTAGRPIRVFVKINSEMTGRPREQIADQVLQASRHDVG
jgi:hypothetical protein